MSAEQDRLYEEYARIEYLTECADAVPDQLTPADTTRIRGDRDRAWQDYLASGGTRPAMHSGAGTSDAYLAHRDLFPDLSVGSTNTDAVRRLQTALGITVTGDFEATTEDAVGTAQANNGLERSGVVDEQTWHVLLFRHAIPVPASSGGDLPVIASTTTPARQLLVIDPPCRYMLALDDVAERTFVNTYNLGIMASLAYSETPERFFSLNFNDRCPRSAIAGHEGHIPIVRAAPDELQDQVSPQYRVHMLRAGAGDVSLDTEVFCAAHPRYVLIGARGTEMNAPDDILTDVLALPSEWVPSTGRVGHNPFQVPTGFNRAFAAVEGQLAAWLTAEHAGDGDTRPFFVTGHSLGGALAAIIACYLRDHFPTRHVNLYTYAQPRASTGVMSEHYWLPRSATANLRYYRCAHTHDLVPMVPRRRLYDSGGAIGAGLRFLFSRDVANILSPPGTDYRHFGHLVQLNIDSGRLLSVDATETAVETDAMLDEEDRIIAAYDPAVELAHALGATSHDSSLRLAIHPMTNYLHSIELEFELNYFYWRDGQAGLLPLSSGIAARDEVERLRLSIHHRRAHDYTLGGT